MGELINKGGESTVNKISYDNYSDDSTRTPFFIRKCLRTLRDENNVDISKALFRKQEGYLKRDIDKISKKAITRITQLKSD